MTEWLQRSTAELIRDGVLEIGDGYRAKNSEFAPNGGLPFVRVGDVGASALRVDGIDELPSKQQARYEPKVSRPGDSLITMKGTVGRVAFVPDDLRPFVYSPQISYWRSHDREVIHPRWLRYWLESPEFAWQASAAKGATDMADYINLRDQRRMQISLPPPEVQERIAEVLGAIDDLIENNRGRIQALEEMARAIYREWFVNFRYPGHEDIPLADSALGPIPDDWMVAELQSVAEVNRRSRTPTKDEVIRYLDISALAERTVGSLSEVVGSEAPGRARRVVEPGDVVWSMVRPNRRAHALLVDPGPEWIASTGLAVLSATTASSTWLFETTSTKEFSDYLVSQEGGAAYPAVKPKDFQRAPVVVPPPSVDRLFAERVAPMHRLCWSLREHADALASLRDLLLPELVTGQIDVSHLDLDALTQAAIA